MLEAVTPLEGSAGEESANTEEVVKEGFLEEGTLSTWKPKIGKRCVCPRKQPALKALHCQRRGLEKGAGEEVRRDL